MAEANHDTGQADDIQRALQLAIGQVNSSFEASASLHKASSAPKKRSREGEELTRTTANNETKRKNKKRKQGEHVVIEGPGEPAINDEGRGEEIPIDPQLSAPSVQNPTATTAFLSALVAAASATSDQQHAPDNLQQYPGYPPYQYPPTQEYPSPGLPQQQESLFPIAPGLTGGFPQDAAFANLNTNEDVLRALQELDVSKLAVVLKSLGDAASAAQVSFGYSPQGDSGSGSTSGAGSSHIPTSSAAILGHNKPPKQSRDEKRARAGAVALASMPHARQSVEQDPEHAHTLANKWLNAGKLAELVKTKGLTYKKGKFSTVEDAQIKAAIDNYRTNKGVSEEQLNEIIFSKGPKNKDTAFWSEITSQVPQRPIIAVYHHVRRTHHPMKQQGKWMPAEDEFLKIAVAEHGQAWEKVSLRVGRMAADCRDRWRNHISNREMRVSGQWSKEEEEELTRIVTEMTIAQGKDQENDVFWGQVAVRMGNRRGRQQCRIKWTDSLSKTVKNEGHKPRWSQQDAFILVHKIASMDVRDDSEIDWKLLSDNDWNLWSAHSLQRRWLTLKRSVRGHEDMSHQEIMDILRVKKAHAPPPPSAPRKNKVSSSEMVPMEDSPANRDAGLPEHHVLAPPMYAPENSRALSSTGSEAHALADGGVDAAEEAQEVVVADGGEDDSSSSPSSSSSDSSDSD